MPLTAEQLRLIIRDSDVLTEAEKQEWGRLVEFMNDKQLSDLHSILIPHQANTQNVSKDEVPQMATIAPSTQVDKHEEKPSPYQTGGNMQVKEKESATIPPVSSDSNSKTVPSFGEGASLSDFLKQTSNQSSAIVQEPIQKPTSEGHVETRQEVSSPDLDQKPNDLSNSQFSLDQSILDHLSVTPADDSSTKSKNNLEVEETEGVESVVNESENDIGGHTSQNEYSEVSADNQKVVEVNNLEDLQSVGIATLRELGPQDLYERLKNLVRRKGYFDVIFSFEKSPLYKAYLHTGMQAISDSLDLDKIKVKGDVLNREEFEIMTDILRSLGAG